MTGQDLPDAPWQHPVETLVGEIHSAAENGHTSSVILSVVLGALGSAMMIRKQHIYTTRMALNQGL